MTIYDYDNDFAHYECDDKERSKLGQVWTPYSIGLIQTVQIRNAIEDERKHRYDGHNSPSHWYEHEPHR